MEDLKRYFPDGVDYKIYYDTTPYIRESVYEVFYTLRDAIILVAIVVLLFLQDWRAMILPMIDVPVSLIGTFAIMALLGFSLNNLTLFGLVLAIGIVVDDAIVVLENIERQIATGLNARDATIKAMDEITGPVLAITLVLSAVFIPCCFLGGISGQFFRQFAVTIAVSTIISAINALTMTPSRAVLIFRADEKAGHEHRPEALPWWFFGLLGGVATYYLGMYFLAGKHFGLPAADDPTAPTWLWWSAAVAYVVPGILLGGVIGWFIIRPVNAVLGSFFRGFNRAFNWATESYGAGVGRMLRASAVIMAIYAGMLGLTWWQFYRTPTGFIPQQDKGYLVLNVQLPNSASLERTEKVMAQIEETVRKTPGVAHTIGISGQSLILNANAPNLGSFYVLLEEFGKRRHSGRDADSVGAEIQRRCHDQQSDAIVAAFGAPPIDGLGTTGGFDLIVEARGNLGLSDLERVSGRIVAQGSKTPGLRDLFNSSGADTPWVYLDINRDKCMTEGVAVSDVFSTLQVYLGSYYVNNFNDFGRTWQVNVQALPQFRARSATCSISRSATTRVRWCASGR